MSDPVVDAVDSSSGRTPRIVHIRGSAWGDGRWITVNSLQGEKY